MMAAAWDFFRQFNAFADYSIGNLSLNATIVYLRLFAANNKIGRIEWFPMANDRLVAETGLTIPTINRAKKDLVERGFIKYREGKKGSPTKYKLTILYDEKFLKQLNNFNENSFNENDLMKTDLTNPYPNLYPKRSESFNESVPCSLTQNAENTSSDTGLQPLQSRVEEKRKEKSISSVENGDTDDLTNSDEFAKTIAAFEEYIHPVKNELEKDELIDLISTYGADKVIAVIKHAVETQKQKGDRVQSLKYLVTILQRWKNNGFKELGGNKNNGRYGRENDGSVGRREQRGINRRHNEENGTRNAIFANQSEPWNDE